jgi:hypothetical protein
MYTPYLPIEGSYTIQYENPSTGEMYHREGVRSKVQPTLPANVLTLQDILENTAKETGTLEFKNTVTGTILKTNRSLILSENIKCETVDYSFDSSLPSEIIRLTINQQLVPFLLKMKKKAIMEYLYRVQYRYEPSYDPDLPKKVKQFMGRDVIAQRQKIIDDLKAMGYNGEDELWDMYTLEELKNEYKRLK